MDERSMTDTAFSVYLPPDPQAPPWGVEMIAGGIGVVKPGDPYPTSGHPAERSQSWERGRILDEWQIICIVRGSGTWQTRQHRSALKGPVLIVLAPGVWHQYQPDPLVGWEERWIAYRGALPDRLGRDGVLNPHVLLPLDGQAGLRAALDATLAVLQHGGPGARGEASAAAAMVLARLARLHLDAEAAPGDAALHAVAAELARAGPNGIAIAALARRCRLSPATFRRRFARLHGCQPKTWHARALITRAQRLLADPQTRIQDVAVALGFADPFYFSRMFARITGSSPRAWRSRRGTSD